MGRDRGSHARPGPGDNVSSAISEARRCPRCDSLACMVGIGGVCATCFDELVGDELERDRRRYSGGWLGYACLICITKKGRSKGPSPHHHPFWERWWFSLTTWFQGRNL